jgi:DNA-directed RNA polymerase subunit RPC12/RpoP
VLKLRIDKIWFGSCFGAFPAVHVVTWEESMECPKCKGLMMLERFSDFFLIFYAWKCINCGAIIDRTISNNRRKSLAARDQQLAQPVATR